MYRTRSWRRAQRERIIARAERHLREKGWFERPYLRWAEEELGRIIGMHAATPHPCSRYCCGNPRRHAKGFEAQTRQEHLADLRFRDEDQF